MKPTDADFKVGIFTCLVITIGLSIGEHYIAALVAIVVAILFAIGLIIFEIKRQG
jgi:hypothetical protein